MKEKQALLEFGLSESEAQTYLTLFRLGGATASVLAKETGLQRTTVYPILKSLAKKGCVLVYFRKNQHHYYAQKPDKLASLFEKKLEFFNSVVPLFESMDRKQAQAIGVRFIETKEELRKFYMDILDDHKSYRIIGNAHTWQNIDPEFFEQYREMRADLKIKTRLLLSADSKQDNPTAKDLLREVRFLPAEYEFKSTMNIFNDKVLIISPETSSLAVVIAVPAMVDIFKSMFEIIWSNES
ncbi:MAG: helix-turn-helix domain-containing protein [Candidatus Moranbacteria bacterium]|nr:helix-turn-helix domain-containing protein [Candidatus Moranbacteria bacterium]